MEEQDGHTQTFYRKNPDDKQFLVKATKSDVFWLTFSILIYLYFIVNNLKHHIIYSVNDTLMSRFGMILVYLGFTFQTAGCAFMNFCNRYKILKLFNRMLAVERKGRALGFIIDYEEVGRRIRRRNIIFTVLSLAIWTTNFTVYWLYRKQASTFEMIFLVASYFWIYIGYFMFVFNIILVARIGLARYINLSYMLDFYGEKICLKTESHERIMQIAEVHNMMNNCLRIGNKSFTTQMIPWVLTIMTASIFNTFQFYRIGAQYDHESLLRALNNLVWCIFNWTFILYLIYNANEYLEENKKVAECIQRLLCRLSYKKDKEIVKRLQFYSRQVNHQIPVISCGLFPVDYSLIFSMATTLITFVIILIQFDVIH